jgi:hypothetical protein
MGPLENTKESTTLNYDVKHLNILVQLECYRLSLSKVGREKSESFFSVNDINEQSAIFFRNSFHDNGEPLHAIYQTLWNLVLMFDFMLDQKIIHKSYLEEMVIGQEKIGPQLRDALLKYIKEWDR